MILGIFIKSFVGLEIKLQVSNDLHVFGDTKIKHFIVFS